jgi:hypothetical protein
MSISPTNFGDFIALPEKQTQKQLNLPSAIRSHQIQAVRELFLVYVFCNCGIPLLTSRTNSFSTLARRWKATCTRDGLTGDVIDTIYRTLPSAKERFAIQLFVLL